MVDLKRVLGQPRGRFLRLKIKDKNGRFKKGVKSARGTVPAVENRG
jgi:hypothetical protein